VQITFDPVVSYVGSFAVRWYLILELIALAAYFIFFRLEAKRKVIPVKHVYMIIAVIIVFALVFGKMMDAAQNLWFYTLAPQYLFTLGEERINGVLAGGLVGTLLYCSISRLSFWNVSDARVAGIPLAIAIGRIGCFINGCCYGTPCEFPFAVIYSSPHALAPAGVPLYPVQLIQATWNLAVFIVIWLVRKRVSTPGLLYLLFLIMFSSGDFIIRFMRQDNEFLLNLHFAQIVDAVILLLSSAALYVRQKMPIRVRVQEIA
jgi:phosphatidylglycerol:prolipoprotein diacylglycerol transferase